MESKPVYEAEKGDRTVSCDLEAAETLAGLASGSSVRGGESDQLAIHLSQSCSTSYPSNPTSKLRQHLTEAEKEERRIRRILANRESARQTIRRRQATYLEFTKKAADLTEENESLKKEKELAMKEYNSLKKRNAFLKLQMSKLKKAQSREMQEVPKSASGGRRNSVNMSTPPPYNHPVLVPFLWPPVVPSSNVFQLQYHDISSVNRGQEIHPVNTGLGNPLFVLPVPWLLPCPGHGNSLHSHSGTNWRPNETVPPHQRSMSLSSDYCQPSSFQNVGVEGCNSTKAVPAGSGDQYISHHHRPNTPLDLNLRPVRHSPAHKLDNPNNGSASEHLSQGLSSKKNQETTFCQQKTPENVFAATKARRKRKELMRLKNIPFRHHPD